MNVDFAKVAHHSSDPGLFLERMLPRLEESFRIQPVLGMWVAVTRLAHPLKIMDAVLNREEIFTWEKYRQDPVIVCGRPKNHKRRIYAAIEGLVFDYSGNLRESKSAWAVDTWAIVFSDKDPNKSYFFTMSPPFYRRTWEVLRAPLSVEAASPINGLYNAFAEID